MDFKQFQEQALKEYNSKVTKINTSKKELSEAIADDKELDAYDEATRLFYRISSKIANSNDDSKLPYLHIALTILSQAINLYDRDKSMSRRLLAKARRIATKQLNK